MTRERLTYKKLFERCYAISRDIERGKLDRERGAELHISFDEFCDLRQDMEFVHSILWAHMSEPLKQFECCGVVCVIDYGRSQDD